MGSTYARVQPTIFYLNYDWTTNALIIRMAPGASMRTALRRIEEVVRKYNPDGAFAYHFVDEDYARKFSDEERIGRLSIVLTLLAIVISCLGLLGLSSFIGEQRTKEIGIRKVLGASVPGLWGMLSKEFVWLVIVACVIAMPMSWWLPGIWLQQYEYRTGLSWEVFVGVGLGALLVAILTVSYQSVKVALGNPVESLRDV